jgi:2-oxoglutarate ferredoxin oxidoreductase subunit gamma
MAGSMGNVRVANIIALGAFIEKTGIVRAESVAGAIEELFSQKKTPLVEINKEALAAGAKEILVNRSS